MSEKKVVGRTVAIALGIVCIILIAGLVGAMEYYTNTSNNSGSDYNTLNSEYNSLQSTYNDYVSSHSHTDSDYNSLSSQNTNLQNQINDLNNIVNLAESAIWVNDETVNQPAGSYTNWTPAFSASYAGYVSVNVHTSTTTKTYVRMIYTSHGVSYDNQIEVGTGGTAIFPILPSSSIDIRIGNTNLLNGATETVTITYYY